jgi:hypothetical protein
MSNGTTLASAEIGRESITVELTELDGQATVTITWPTKSLSVSPRRFPDVAATLTRMFANASTELARMKAGDRRSG